MKEYSVKSAAELEKSIDSAVDSDLVGDFTEIFKVKLLKFVIHSPEKVLQN